MESNREYRIITNNPLVKQCVPKEYLVEFHEGIGYRDVLVLVRDLVYAGHELYTHPIAGSVKPNETPYKSIVIDKTPGQFSMEAANLMANALITFDKFKPLNVKYSDYHFADFRMIDYTLLCSALDVDAIAGLSKVSINTY